MSGLELFGIRIGRRPPPPPPPTPLEIATQRYVETQHALLTAQDEQERANSSVLMFEGRRDRLREAIRELADETRGAE